MGSGYQNLVVFIGLGLTQSLLRDVRGLSGFLGMLTACWCLLKATPEVGREGTVGWPRQEVATPRINVLPCI
ncbi:hypothetical protein MA04_02776 [Alcanivorax balearicus MACL04]|uniref:Uncharacterized protein n=1 Tax=Alloalcanivorax balearicus MACL04 TaxID=1177182 RepID=A0ABT2R118_9GAMM|nr:hypothetical protein [Alloalcanivorax balearicus MACL04]